MSDGVSRRRLWSVGFVCAGVAAVANGAIFSIARAADVSPLVPSFGADSLQEVTLGQVVLSTLLIPFIGTALAAPDHLAWVGPHRSTNPRGMASVSLAAPPLLDADLATKLVLALMHLVTGAVFVFGLERSK